jgi:hypothetical protein
MARNQGRVPWAGLISRWYGLEGAGEALRAVADRAILKAGIAPGT